MRTSASEGLGRAPSDYLQGAYQGARPGNRDPLAGAPVSPGRAIAAIQSAIG